MPLLDPKGPIGVHELFVIGVAFVLMLIVVIPVTVMALWFPRRYKASDPKGKYDPKWSYSAKLDLVVWLVPAAIVVALGTLSWRETHRTDPFDPIESNAKPLAVEVVSLDWKWLFIYPQQHIATVDRLVLPVHVPVAFRLTSDTVVTSFFIPRLGSQVYAMAGRQSRLHLLADQTGVYRGQNQQFSGSGYSDMHFTVRVVSPQRFNAWVRQAGQAPERLDAGRFEKLRRPSAGSAVTSFSGVERGLFKDIVDGYRAAANKTRGAPQSARAGGR